VIGPKPPDPQEAWDVLPPGTRVCLDGATIWMVSPMAAAPVPLRYAIRERAELVLSHLRLLGAEIVGELPH
jgi:hypothetical protein